MLTCRKVSRSTVLDPQQTFIAVASLQGAAPEVSRGLASIENNGPNHDFAVGHFGEIVVWDLEIQPAHIGREGETSAVADIPHSNEVTVGAVARCGHPQWLLVRASVE